MIGAILAFVLLVIVGGCVAGAVIFRSKKHRNKKFFTVCVAVACVAFSVFMLLPFSIHTVEPGQVAVVKVLGKAEYVRDPGTYFDFWLTRQYDMLDTTVQQEQISTMCYSADAQTMDVTLVVQFQIRKDKAIEIDNNYNTINRLTERVRSISEDNVKTVLSQKSAMNIIETRSTVSPDIETLIKKTVEERNYYVDIVTVVITNIDFSDAFEKVVEDKMIAEQEKLKAEYEKEKAIIEAEKELEVAKLEAEARIAHAQGDAEAVRLAAEAEANAIKVKSIEVARMLGFEITETVVEDGVVYSIDFTGKSAEEINLISEYLKYIAYLEKWDGQLPDVMGEGANVFLPIEP